MLPSVFVIVHYCIWSGAEGNVDESLKAMAEVDDLKKQKRIAEVNFVISCLTLLFNKHLCICYIYEAGLYTVAWLKFPEHTV